MIRTTPVNPNLNRSQANNILRRTSRLPTSSLTFNLQVLSINRHNRRSIANVSRSRARSNHYRRITLSLLNLTLARRPIISRRANRLLTSHPLSRYNNRDQVSATKRTTSNRTITSLDPSHHRLIIGSSNHHPHQLTPNSIMRRSARSLLTMLTIRRLKVRLRTHRPPLKIFRHHRKDANTKHDSHRPNQHENRQIAIKRPSQLLHQRVNRRNQKYNRKRNHNTMLTYPNTVRPTTRYLHRNLRTVTSTRSQSTQIRSHQIRH